MNKFLSVFMTISLLMFSQAYSETLDKVTAKTGIINTYISIDAIDDPNYPWITCYVTSVERWGEDPSNSSIACRLIGEIPKSLPPLNNNDNVFEKAKGVFFKKTSS